ncbi:MAG: ArsI/CadI family heavy metal resistance metalloenzyme [Gammaproteobacteria bacterium]|jgi:catechol 2,3-dioxygenase-like lactoylglutathione lyase family enzyme
MRIQLALNVQNIDDAVAYYAKLFDTQPHKRRAGYANFAIESPPLKLVLFENPDATERLHHVGVEVFETEQIDRTARRLLEQGILDQVQRDETCCHATQDKLWSQEPQGLRWEWYRITNDAPTEEPGSDGVDKCNVAQAVGKACCS